MINIRRLFVRSTVRRPQVQIHNRMSTGKSRQPVTDAISLAITQKLQPVHLEVINESYMHNVPKGSETHFKVLVVSKSFDGLSLINRHRLVNTIVKENLGEHFPHALSIDAKTPQQWEPSYVIEPSPNCRGGFGK